MQLRVSLQLITFLYRICYGIDWVRSVANQRPLDLKMEQLWNEVARNTDSIYKTPIYSQLSWQEKCRMPAVTTNCSIPSDACPWNPLEKHVGDKGLFRGDSARAWRSPHGIIWFVSSSICPCTKERGKGQLRHHNLKGNWIGSSLQHVGSIFLKKLIA